MNLNYLIILCLNLNIYHFFSNNKCINNFLFYLKEINQKEILIIEINHCHGECIPGFIKYFNSLGYENFEILLTYKLYKQKLFDFTYFKYNIKYLIFSKKQINKFISLGMCNFYKICLFNTIDNISLKINKLINSNKKFKNIGVLHNKAKLKKKHKFFDNIIVLKKFNSNLPFYEVNPHYFGDYNLHKKSKIINFITAGNLSDKRKNFKLLINSVDKLIYNNILNFHVKIIGSGGRIFKKLAKKKKLMKYISFTGRISYSLMYKYISNSDFFLPLLDSKKHKNYISSKTSGSFQLSYGFNIPMIIEKTFAKVYNFSNNNSVIYNNYEDFYDKLKFAININEEDYNMMKEGLKLKTKNIELNSLENLKNILSK